MMREMIRNPNLRLVKWRPGRNYLFHLHQHTSNMAVEYHISLTHQKDYKYLTRSNNDARMTIFLALPRVQINKWARGLVGICVCICVAVSVPVVSVFERC